MELNKKVAYNLTTKQNVAYGQVTHSELEENVAERENIYEPPTKPLDLDQNKVDTLAVNKSSFRETATVRVERVYRTSTTIASIALVLSFLALLVAIVSAHRRILGMAPVVCVLVKICVSSISFYKLDTDKLTTPFESAHQFTLVCTVSDSKTVPGCHYNLC